MDNWQGESKEVKSIKKQSGFSTAALLAAQDLSVVPIRQKTIDEVVEEMKYAERPGLLAIKYALSQIYD